MEKRGYIVRPSGVAHETIDGETVILDMQKGTYYRLEGVACIVWEQLAAGASLEQLCSGLAARFTTAPETLERQLLEFLDGLRTDNLIVAHETNGSTAAPPIADVPMSDVRAAFPGLSIHRFTDLQELFLLDPVHEVDDTGWPSASPPSGGS
jgi:hypothetical protein